MVVSCVCVVNLVKNCKSDQVGDARLMIDEKHKSIIQPI